MKFYSIASLLFSVILMSCSDDANPSSEPSGAYDGGLLILNEGSFGNSNASVSFVSPDFSEIENNIFQNTNQRILGDVAQSIGFYEHEAFIVLNSSNKIEVVDRYSFESITTITEGFMSPRYFMVANSKAYVSDWGNPTNPSDDFIAIVNLETYTVENTIPVSEGPERMLNKNGKLYVAHLGGYNSNNVVSVIEGTTVTEIEVNDNPDEIFFDDSGDLWVLCQGKIDWSGNGGDTPGAIVKISTNNDEVEKILEFEPLNHPDLMTYDNETIYFGAGGQIFEMAMDANTLPTEPVLQGNFYGMKANDGLLYTTDATDFASQGILRIFDLETFNDLFAFDTGVAPTKVYFN
ncbi:MAG TPA: DUF5074 domain-containing protein [Salinimicrobium sp.]|nr:DUF5074 domain-containing protein [Salinimicrobium sp.]